MPRGTLATAALLATALCLPGDQGPPDATANARTFLGSLSQDLKAKAQLPLQDENRTFWQYVPAQRKGVAWKDLNPEQTTKADALLRASLSDLGVHRVETVRKVESVLAEIERNPRGRDKDNYLFTFYGEPSETADWAWRYEGHHVSLSFTYRGSKLVASTPQFFGSNPAEVKDGPEKGTRMLSKEEDMAFALLASLSEEQRKKAVIEPNAPSDIFTSMSRKAGRLDDRGIKFTDLTKPQQQALVALVRQNALAQRQEELERRMAKVEKAGLDHLVFAWMGGDRPGVGHYWRIQGPTFVIEFDNTQNGANHIHLVWRDFEGDFGRDVLGEHYVHDHAHGN